MVNWCMAMLVVMICMLVVVVVVIVALPATHGVIARMVVVPPCSLLASAPTIVALARAVTDWIVGLTRNLVDAGLVVTIMVVG